MVECTDPLLLAKGSPIIWRRPHEFMKSGDIALFQEGILPADIKQGTLGNCWLMCALAACSEFPSLVEGMFPAPYDKYNPNGIYKVKLCKGGEWTTITLDDYFPCTPFEGPIYSRANGDELWVLLLEKAFAKLHGSYAMLRSGWPFEAMMDLTGAPYKDIRIKDADVQKQITDGSLFRYLCECDKKGYIMSLSTPGTDKYTSKGSHGSLPNGLVPGHAYTMITAITTTNGYKLAKIRNPWGATEWNGDFSDRSLLWTPELAEEVGFVNDPEDGTFWMSFKDIVRHFVGINICRSRHEKGVKPWNEARQPSELSFSKKGKGLLTCNMYKLTVKNPTNDYIVSVHQKDKRCLGSKPYIDIGVTILQRTARMESFKYIASSGNSMERQNQLDVTNLPVGEYVIIPTSTGAKMEQYRSDAESSGQPFQSADFGRRIMLVVHGLPDEIKLEEIPFDKEALEEHWNCL